MTIAEFIRSTTEPSPPTQIDAPLLALWLDARDEWGEAHAAVQDETTADAAWVHAYLHRKEGDISNARYWYQRARRPESGKNLPEEWTEIATRLLGRA